MYPMPQPPERKWLKTKYLCEVESLRQAKENNTPFTFWLLPRRIPLLFPKKMRESGGGFQILDRRFQVEGATIYAEFQSEI
jgi:hypothetical protein